MSDRITGRTVHRLRPLSLSLMLGLVALLLVGCARPPEVVGILNPQIPVASVPAIRQQKIFITTTREASAATGAFFSAGRAPGLGLASVEVTIPPPHVTGQLERAQRLPPDPRTEFSIVDPRIYRSDASFIAEINRALAERPPEQRTLLLFVHGFNNTPSDSLLRLAQFVEDTGFQGVPVLFSWASAARTHWYVYDLNSTLIARGKFLDTMKILAQTRARHFDIFAHSMGTLLAMEGLANAEKLGALARIRGIGNIVLASPDIDIDLFTTQISFLPLALRQRMYLLISRNDRALRTSRRIAGGVPRVGAADTALLEGFGMTVVDLSEITDSSSGSHSKFAGSPGVVQLIGAGLNSSGRFESGAPLGLDHLLIDLPIRVFRQ